ncbi:Small GTPase superfamily ARF/SAR type [Trinorchestia longiramus]|nr:Small GTPase superfamily ARF/SAR type [Trinorchestia longiramus]
MVFTFLLRKLKKENKNIKILFLGLDNAGKSTILEKYFQIKNTGPTFGYKKYELQDMTILDAGGQGIIRKYWRNYYENVDGVIYVYDLTDPRNFMAIFDELRADPVLSDAHFLLVGNKKDLVKGEIEMLDGVYDFDVAYVSAKSNDGVKEALDKFISKIKTE